METDVALLAHFRAMTYMTLAAVGLGLMADNWRFGQDEDRCRRIELMDQVLAEKERAARDTDDAAVLASIRNEFGVAKRFTCIILRTGRTVPAVEVAGEPGVFYMLLGRNVSGPFRQDDPRFRLGTRADELD